MKFRDYILSSEGKSLEETYETFNNIYRGDHGLRQTFALFKENSCEVESELFIYDLKNAVAILNRTKSKGKLEHFGNLCLISLENLMDDVEKDILKNGFKLERK